MAQDAFSYFKIIILVQLFFSFGVTMISYYMPTDVQNYVTLIDTSHTTDFDSVTDKIQQSVEKQTNIPMLDMGALIFYSGNIILDMILNTIFAIPEMVTIALNLMLHFIPIHSYIATYIKLLIFVVIAAIYIIGIIAWITNYRSSGSVSVF